MAQKNYDKGAAQRAQSFARYITRYNLDNPGSIRGGWTAPCQQAAVAILAACNTINGAVTFREQP